MHWFEFSTTCKCGVSEYGYIPAEERFNIRCEFCSRYQRPLFLSRHDDDITYDEYLDLLLEEEEDDEDEDWEEWEEE